MVEEAIRYKSYLLRLWQGPASPPEVSWRATLQCVQTGESHHFPDLEALMVYLQANDDDCDHSQVQVSSSSRKSL